jgi:ribonuclease R
MIFQNHWIVYWVKSSEEEQNLVDTLTIRTMSKAKYSTDNRHYGLAFDYYSHFTSPIRRYLTLWYTFATVLSWWWKSADEETYEAKCLHSSTMEGLATSAERILSNTCRWNTCKIIRSRILGVISGVTEWEFLSKLSKINVKYGRIRDIKDDYYTFDENSMLV